MNRNQKNSLQCGKLQGLHHPRNLNSVVQRRNRCSSCSSTSTASSLAMPFHKDRRSQLLLKVKFEIKHYLTFLDKNFYDKECLVDRLLWFTFLTNRYWTETSFEQCGRNQWPCCRPCYFIMTMLLAIGPLRLRKRPTDCSLKCLVTLLPALIWPHVIFSCYPHWRRFYEADNLTKVADLQRAVKSEIASLGPSAYKNVSIYGLKGVESAFHSKGSTLKRANAFRHKLRKGM